MKDSSASHNQAKAASAVRRLMGHRRLRNLLGAWAVSNTVLWAWVITISTLVFQLGGPSAVALALACRLVPGALVSPFATVLASRWDQSKGAMVAVLLRVAAILGGALVLALDGPPVLLYASVAVEGLGSGPMHALHNRLLPLTARMPDELALANSLTELFRATGLLLGPAIAALVLYFLSAVWVTVMCIALLLMTLPMLYAKAPPARTAGPPLVPQHVQLQEGVLHAVTNRTTAMLVAVFVLCGLVTGSVQVFVTAVGTDTAGWGVTGPSILLSLIGFGGLLGGLISIPLLGLKDLSGPLALGLFGIGMACVALGTVSGDAMYVLSSILGGSALAVALVVQSTLFQRRVALALQAAVFGLSAMLHVLGIGLGGALGSVLIHSLGVNSALVAFGIGLGLLSAAVWPLVRATTVDIGARQRELEVLRQSKLLNMLAIGPSEQVAAYLQPQMAAPGEVIIKQGEAGDDAYLVETGEVDVVVNGKKIAELTGGDVFGEIALLHDVPRTATIIAARPTQLWKLNRHAFLFAVTATPECHQLMTLVAKRRLEELAKTHQ